jgi:hypothetical protein
MLLPFANLHGAFYDELASFVTPFMSAAWSLPILGLNVIASMREFCTFCSMRWVSSLSRPRHRAQKIVDDHKLEDVQLEVPPVRTRTDGRAVAEDGKQVAGVVFSEVGVWKLGVRTGACRSAEWNVKRPSKPATLYPETTPFGLVFRF